MKTLVLWYGFVKKNIFPMLITSLMLTVSMFTLVTFYGKYEYTAYSRDILLDSDLRNGGYMMIYHDDEAIRDPEKMTERALEIKETVSAHPACKYILTTDSFVSSLRDDKMAGYNCFLYDENMISGFGLRTDSGRWLTNSSDIIEGVIIGNTYERKVGDVVELDNGISVKIVGIVDTPPIYPDFGRYSNYKCPASSLFSNGSDILVISANAVPDDVKDSINYHDRYKNCYVVFDDDAAESGKNDLISYMESQGVFAPYDGIIADSDNEIDMCVRRCRCLCSCSSSVR